MNNKLKFRLFIILELILETIHVYFNIYIGSSVLKEKILDISSFENANIKINKELIIHKNILNKVKISYSKSK